MRAEAAGEEAISVRDVHDVTRATAGGANRARHHCRPGVDVVARVADDRGLAGRSRRRVDARDLTPWHGEHAERVVVAQVALHGEWKARGSASRRSAHARTPVD